MAYIKPDPFWDNLHSDSRYLDLLRRMGLPGTAIRRVVNLCNVELGAIRVKQTSPRK